MSIGALGLFIILVKILIVTCKIKIATEFKISMFAVMYLICVLIVSACFIPSSLYTFISTQKVEPTDIELGNILYASLISSYQLPNMVEEYWINWSHVFQFVITRILDALFLGVIVKIFSENETVSK